MEAIFRFLPSLCRGGFQLPSPYSRRCGPAQQSAHPIAECSSHRSRRHGCPFAALHQSPALLLSSPRIPSRWPPSAECRSCSRTGHKVNAKVVAVHLFQDFPRMGLEKITFGVVLLVRLEIPPVLPEDLLLYLEPPEVRHRVRGPTDPIPIRALGGPSSQLVHKFGEVYRGTGCAEDDARRQFI